MFAVEVYAAVRHFVFVEGNSQRAAARVFGLSRETISKMCRFSLPPGYTRVKPVAKPKLGALLPVIDAILEADGTARVAHQRQQAVRTLAKVHRLARQEHLHARRYHAERTARRTRRSAVSLSAGLTRMVTSPITISTIGSGAPSAPASLPLLRKARRQPKSCAGEIPRRRARAETFTPGSSAARTACSLKSSDHRRRSPTGAPSKRSTTASTNCKLPVAGIGVEPVIDMKPRSSVQ